MRRTGGAELRIRGAEPWRFLDRCAADDLLLEDVREEDVFSLRCSVRARDLPRVRELARRSGCETEVLALRGLPRAWRRLRRRWAFFLGAAVTAAALFVSSLFIWDIRVTENDSGIPDGEILRVLEEQGVGAGCFWPGLKADLVRSRALARLPELSWLAVNVRGTRAWVEVRAAVPAPELWDPRRVSDVTAARAGVITEMTVLEGTPLAARGDAVLPGQILISAARPGGAAGERTVHARGEVTAHTWYELTAAAPLTVTETEDTGRESRRFALILGRTRINFYRDSGILPANCDKMTRTWAPWAGSAFPLPVAWVTETLRPYTAEERPADAAALRAALEARLSGWLRETMGARGEVLSERFSVTEDGTLLTVTLRAECRERIDIDTPRDNDP